jgi:hypothetical protein
MPPLPKLDTAELWQLSQQLLTGPDRKAALARIKEIAGLKK